MGNLDFPHLAVMRSVSPSLLSGIREPAKTKGSFRNFNTLLWTSDRKIYVGNQQGYGRTQQHCQPTGSIEHLNQQKQNILFRYPENIYQKRPATGP